MSLVSSNVNHNNLFGFLHKIYSDANLSGDYKNALKDLRAIVDEFFVLFGQEYKYLSCFNIMLKLSESPKFEGNDIIHYLQDFRIKANASAHSYTANAITKNDLEQGIMAVAKSYAIFYDLEVPTELARVYADTKLMLLNKRDNYRVNEKVDLRVIVKEQVDAGNFLNVFLEFDAQMTIYKLYYNRELKEFKKNLKKLNPNQIISLPDAEINEQLKIINCDFAIIEPDYLMNVTDIAEGIQDDGYGFLNHYIVKKYEPFKSNKHLVLGNIANRILDMLIHEEADKPLQLKSVFEDAFSEYSLDLAVVLKTDADSKELREKIESNLDNIRQTLKEQVQNGLKLNQKGCLLEPSFLSPRYGLQGRLDALFISDSSQVIIELKSSGMKQREQARKSHNAQAVLYSLLTQRVNTEIKTRSEYILYSSISNCLIKSKSDLTDKQKIINLRNSMVMAELEFAKKQDLLNYFDCIFKYTYIEPNLSVSSFSREQIAKWKELLDQADNLAKKYIANWHYFIFNELVQSKIGSNNDRNHASLWNFDVNVADEHTGFCELKITLNNSTANPPVIEFQRTQDLNEANTMRAGDIIIIHESLQGSNIAEKQIHKGTIISIKPNYVQVQLNQRQTNKDYFANTERWEINTDYMDSSIRKMLFGLWNFLALNSNNPSRQLKILGTLAPNVGEISQKATNNPIAELTDAEEHLVNRAVAAPDYFLISGPPGTGKTSRTLKALVSKLHQNPSERILVMAYTNRAVGEICSSLKQLTLEFIRIGHRHSTELNMQEYLLDAKMAEAKNKDQITELLANNRIFVGTLSSILGKNMLFDMQGGFTTMIVDESSQILEPQLLPLITQVPKFILIGDHKQLPAITLQNEYDTEVTDEDLQEINLYDSSIAYFERLWMLCVRNGWEHAFGTLTRQGRMHQDIMKFPNAKFYAGELQLADREHQLEDTIWKRLNKGQKWAETLSSSRTLYIATKKCETGINKQNLNEAKLIAEIVVQLFKIMKQNGIDKLFSQHIGIIAPYRKQVAAIRDALSKIDLERQFEQITIDTVERYQGSERDIIIVSLCLNNEHQLKSLTNYGIGDNKHVDRKLNVMLTRARKQIIILGNEELMKTDANYSELIADYEQVSLT